MNFPLDESLHSFIFRYQLLQADTLDPIGVVSKKGQWLKWPFAHRGVQPIFHRFNDLFLLEAIDVGYQISDKLHSLFENPQSYALRIHSTFFSDRNTQGYINEFIDIRFCPQCMVEGIREFGYGYFKHNWLKSSWCDEHDVPLMQLPQLSYKESIQAILSVMRGDVPEGSYTKKVNSDQLIPTKKKELHEVELFYPVKATYCVGSGLGDWLAKHAHIIPEILDGYDYFKWVGLSKELILYPPNSRESIRLLKKLPILLLLLEQYAPLKIFFQKSVELVKVPVSPRGQLTELLMTMKSRNCLTCTKRSCLISDAADYEGNLEGKYDRAFLLKHSSATRRLALQQPLLSFVGRQLWSPIKIEQEVDIEQLAQATAIVVQT